MPRETVVYVDGYGNLKTSWTEPPAPSGTTVCVRIGDAAAEAVVSDGTFEVPVGAISFAPGSSGWDGCRFYELLERCGSAADRFAARAGDRVVVEAPD